LILYILIILQKQQYMNKLKTIYFLILFLILIISSNKVQSQIISGNDTLDLHFVESLNDSIDIINSSNYFIDSLGYYFFSEIPELMLNDLDSNFELTEDDLPASEIYDSWDSLQIHYPKFNFSNLNDTLKIPLFVNEKTKFVIPVPGIVTSNFGWRRRHYHYGIDLNLNTGDSVFNCFDGVIRLARRNRSYGNIIVVRHDNGLESLYAHLSSINVSINQRVNAGDLIGLGGNTGRSFGSHLHLELRYLGAAINPRDIIDFETKQLKTDTFNITSNTFKYLKNISKYKKSFKKAKFHKVRKGESLGVIARKNKTTVAKLKKLNRIKGNSVKAGKTIRVK